MRVIVALGERVRALLAPVCAVCGVNAGDPVCSDCIADYFSPAAPRCASCALRLPSQIESEVCGRCQRDAPSFDATIALADYAPPVDGMVVALKFGHRLELARVLGRLLAARIAASWTTQSVLVPVPLAFERQAERGFNQAGEIARAAARALGVALDSANLARVRHNAPQEALKLEARRRNVRNAFAVRGNWRDRHAIVIDDVMTSGATLGEVARVLKAAGAARVTNAIVARTP